MNRVRSLADDESGAAAIEFALCATALITLVYGIFTFGQLMEADVAMQGAIGEGARYATLCLNPTNTGTCTSPTAAQVQTVVTNKLFGPVASLTPSVSKNTTAKTISISLTYTTRPDFLFFRAPQDVTITRSKTIYYAS